jgi:hypothetical protein
VQAPHLGEVLTIHNLERKTELCLQLILPLQCHGGWGGHNEKVDTAPKQEFTGDKTAFDGLPKTYVIGNQQIDARKAKSFPQGEKLVGIKPNARTEWSLKQVSLSGG